MLIVLDKNVSLNIIIIFLFLYSLTHSISANTKRPIIGILTEELSFKLKHHYPQYDSYIAASYVKFIEGAGARVVPIWIGKNKKYYEDILSKVNGVLWPGGVTSFNRSLGYTEAGYKIYKIAEQMNNNGDYFPIWGTCLGFELMTYVIANRIEHRVDCSCNNIALPLTFSRDFRKSRLFKNASSDVIEILKEENVTSNFHRYCITDKNLAKLNLNEKLRVISHNRDKNGLLFVSSLEHKTLPFYGVQFHPEKNIYEWIRGKNIPHGYNATIISQYFANFFVTECRKNSHKFPTTKEEMNSLIYNYSPVYTGLQESSYVQSYFFTKQ